MPEKSGIDAALGTPLELADSNAGAKPCPRAGVVAVAAAAAAHANTMRKSHRGKSMLSSLSWFWR
jgi:hypothetical protein